VQALYPDCLEFHGLLDMLLLLFQLVFVLVKLLKLALDEGDLLQTLERLGPLMGDLVL